MDKNNIGEKWMISKKILAQWFDLIKRIDKYDLQIVLDQMALYAYNEGLDPESHEAKQEFKKMKMRLHCITSNLSMWLPRRKASALLGLHVDTLRKYVDNGSIPTIRDDAGRRLYDVSIYLREQTAVATTYYCRVSSNRRDYFDERIVLVK